MTRWRGATIHIRRGEGWTVEEGAEALDGTKVQVEYGFILDDDARYGGEVAWVLHPDYITCDGPIWIAAGDLIFDGEAKR